MLLPYIQEESCMQGNVLIYYHYMNRTSLPLVLFHYTSFKSVDMDRHSVSTDPKTIKWKKTNDKET